MIRVVVDDLAFVAADAIVRPATVTLQSTTPALRRLEQVGGPEFWRHFHLNQPLAVGAAVVTGGGALPAEFVIHAVVMNETDPVSPTGVRRALQSALERAADWHLARLTIPPLGVGAGQLAMEDAARLMVEVLRGGLTDAGHPSEVCIVVETESDRELFEALLEHPS